LLQVNAGVRTAGVTALSVRTFSRASVGGTAASVITTAAPSQTTDGAKGSSSAELIR
jgi:hypothetical protein